MTDIRRQLAERMVHGPVWVRQVQHLRLTLNSMEQAGHIAATAPARSPGRNMLGLTAAGARHYGLDVAVDCLVELRNRTNRLRPSAALRAQHMDQLAEHVAEGGSLATAAAVIGMSKSYCQNLWREIVASYGWQAA